jgi:hypothetical protein
MAQGVLQFLDTVADKVVDKAAWKELKASAHTKLGASDPAHLAAAHAIYVGLQWLNPDNVAYYRALMATASPAITTEEQRLAFYAAMKSKSVFASLTFFLF